MDESAIGRLEFLESIIQRGLGTFVEVGTALRDIRDNRLYQPKYGQVSFETYCKERWGFSSRSIAYDLITAATVVTNLSSEYDKLPESKTVAVELSPLKNDPEKLRAVWQSVTEAHPNEKITAPMVTEAVRECRASEPQEHHDRVTVKPTATAPSTPAFKPLSKMGPWEASRQDKRIFSIANAMRTIEHLPPLSSEFVSEFVNGGHGFTRQELSSFISWLKTLRSMLPEGE